MNKLENKIILVTGAADGIGAATCRAMAAEGAVIIATDINLEGAQALADSLGNDAIALALDVCDEKAWAIAIKTTLETFGRLDILVNNAGGSGAGSIEDISVNEYKKAMSLNVDSVFIGSKLAIETMKSTGGNIINVSSIHGLRAAAHAASYSAAKGAVRLLTKSIALHCAQHSYQIRCNSIHPGYVLTTQLAAWIDSTDDPKATLDDLLAKHPIGFLAKPEDIAMGIVFLASNDSRFMTGSELVMDGGFELI
ncbi:MAG: SDR family oxidoreductase [Spongiibacteraceae bacterium]